MKPSHAIQDSQAPADLLPPPAGSGRIAPLDGLRGLAILLVMGFHLVEVCGQWRGREWLSEGLRVLFRPGWSGVDLFFVLSGFLITGILLDSRDSPHYFRNFYARRTLRIFPLYYAFLAVMMFLVAPASGEFDEMRRTQAWYWSYAANWLYAIDNRWSGPATHLWSLAIEEQFYIFWPLLVYLLSRRRVLVLCACLILGAPCLRALFLCSGSRWLMAYAATPCRLDPLAVGALIAATIRCPGGVQAVRKWIAPMMAGSFVCLAAILVWRRSLSEMEPVTQVAGFSALAIFYGSVLASLVCWRPGNVLAAALSWRPLRFFGGISYALYLLHPMWACVFGSHAWLSVFGQSWPARLAAYALGSVAAAVLSWHLFEKRILKLKGRFPATVPSQAKPDPDPIKSGEVPQAVNDAVALESQLRETRQ